MIQDPPPTISIHDHHRRLLLLLLVSFVILSLVPGIVSSKAVTLGSIEIFNAHEWLAPKPTVYFHCVGEDKIILPDVKEKHFYYSFKGHESWQPLTELPDKKCKRCGLYELDRVKSDDVFDEWELCPDDFVDGKYVHNKDKEFNATFICGECSPAVGSAQSSSSNTGTHHRSVNAIAAVIISALVSVVVAMGMLVGYRYWQKRRRERDQARFLKLFEDGDDLEDELGMGL